MWIYGTIKCKVQENRRQKKQCNTWEAQPLETSQICSAFGSFGKSKCGLVNAQVRELIPVVCWREAGVFGRKLEKQILK